MQHKNCPERFPSNFDEFTTFQYFLLLRVRRVQSRRAENSASVDDLCESCNNDLGRRRIYHNLDQLVKTDLVTVLNCPEDRRRKRYRTTPTCEVFLREFVSGVINEFRMAFPDESAKECYSIGLGQ